MAARRHHTVSAFLLAAFARDTRNGRCVCMLDKATGRPRMVSPRDATVRKHFYSLDAGGSRDPAVEHVLSVVESAAAPLVTQLGRGEFPVRSERLELALFVAMCWLRTPLWREHSASVLEQLTAAMVAESYRLDPRAAQRAFADSEFDMTPEEIERFRRRFVDDLENGRLGVEMPKNAMIKHFLEGASGASWTLFLLDWTLVLLDDDVPELIIGDTPVSLYDPAPAFPGGGVGPLSSPHAQMFLPLGPRLGLLLEANQDVWDWARAGNLDRLHDMTHDERAEAVDELEGGWAEATPTVEFARELNLRSYAHADRFIFGSQGAVTDARAAARSNRPRLHRVAPRGPRMAMLADDPTSPNGVRVTRMFAPKARD